MKHRLAPCAFGHALALALALALPLAAGAADGKLLLTGGVSTIDGAAGGGLTPWASTGTYASDGQFGASAYLTGVGTRDYSLVVGGAALVWSDRVELSVARQDLDARDNLAPLGLAGLHLKQDIFGAKLRLFGDAVLDSDTLLPQVAAGVLVKRADAGALEPTLTGALGARRHGNDWYVSASKLLLAQGVLVNATLRATRANQNGLLGFGSADDRRYHVEPEVSVAVLLQRTLAVGAEWRAKPDNLNDSVLGRGALKEYDWADVFVAWAPVKWFSLTAAVVDLGRIAPAVQPHRQRGGYLSAQFAY